jgi:hypothetical protein
MDIKPFSLLFLLLVLLSCSGGEGPAPTNPDSGPTRTWEMGFYFTPPRIEPDDVIRTIDLFSERAELAMLHEQLPWAALMNNPDLPAEDILSQPDNNKVGLVNYLRSKGLKIFFMADLTYGLDRSSEPPELLALGRHITEAEVRERYIDYVLAVARELQPDYLGLTAETNLVRQAAGSDVYNAMVQATNDAADALIAENVSAPLLISVQAETAWGILGDGATGVYQGINRDLEDFPFAQMIGLSTYPYFAFTEPEDIPDNYYSRILAGSGLPAMITEGGWVSTSVATIVSTPETQARYLQRQAELLDSINARAVIQTLFADIDIDSLTPPLPDILPLFINIGLMDEDYTAKPALQVWDSLFTREKI